MVLFKHFMVLSFKVMVCVIIHHKLKIIVKANFQITYYFVYPNLFFIDLKLLIDLLLDHMIQLKHDFQLHVLQLTYQLLSNHLHTRLNQIYLKVILVSLNFIPLFLYYHMNYINS